MPEYNSKRKHRIEKRNVKKTGNRTRRRFLKKSLEENPEDAEDDVFHFDNSENSKVLNDNPFYD